MFLGLTAAAFAQATYSVGSIPVTAVVNTGQVELTGSITFSQVNNGNNSNLGTITVTYPAPITVAMAALNAATAGVRIVNASGYAIDVTNPPTLLTTVGILSVSSGATTGYGQVVIQVPSGVGPTGTFTLTGIRVAIAGTTLTSMNATISTTNNAVTAGQTTVTVISSIAAGISAVNASGSGRVVGAVNATTGVVGTQPTLTVTEGFLNAWGDPANSTNAGIRITLTSALPTGVTITFPATVTSNGVNPIAAPTWATINADGTANGAAVVVGSTTSPSEVLYRATVSTDPTKQEILTIPVTVSTAAATLPLPTATLQFTASMAPIGTAFTSTNAVITTAALIPRYAASEVGPGTVYSITGTTTTLLVPFAQTVTNLNYNTGLAIANTTKDPGATATTFTAPVAQSGTVKFYFYPQVAAGGTAVPTSFSYTTTAGSPGTGLDAAGNVLSGSTYTVLLSQLLSAAGAAADFSGYVVIITNFTNAHALYNISNYAGFSQGTLALVINGARNIVAENLNQ